MTVYSAVAADSLFRPSPSPLQMLQIIMKEYNLLSGFPNVCIALGIYLTLPVSNCSGEISLTCSHLSFFRPSPSPLQMLQIIMKEYNLLSGFPNVCIALGIYLTLPVSNCSGERSLSHLKRMENALRSTMGQDRLTNLTLMNNECEIVQRLDFQDIVDSFSIMKAGRKQF